MEAEKARKQKELRAKKGIESDEEEEEEAEGKEPLKAAEPGQLPADDSAEEEVEEEEDPEDNKPKGVSHLIEVENPNRAKPKTKNVTSISADDAASASAEPTLSRKEREELEKQQAKEHYQKLHMAGKTKEARADLARLALIRKQREDGAKKRDEERKAAKDANTAAEQLLLDKKQKAGTGD